jgi:hypothetical protein
MKLKHLITHYLKIPKQTRNQNNKNVFRINEHKLSIDEIAVHL